jgi:hypothetical protein
MIGKGSFGEVFRGIYTEKEERKKKYPKFVAIKVENDLTKVSQIGNEIAMMTALEENKANRYHFPRLHASGV